MSGNAKICQIKLLAAGNVTGAELCNDNDVFYDCKKCGKPYCSNHIGKFSYGKPVKDGNNWIVPTEYCCPGCYNGTPVTAP